MSHSEHAGAADIIEGEHRSGRAGTDTDNIVEAAADALNLIAESG
jgi:hypothetical protein